MDQHVPAGAESQRRSERLIETIRASVIGEDDVVAGPFGLRRVTYADYTASGTGLQTTRFREDARRIIRNSVGGTDGHAVIFCGAGSTAAINRLVDVMNLRLPADLAARYDLRDAIPADERPVVFIGPFEHHSNELPWRESIADVLVIR